MIAIGEYQFRTWSLFGIVKHYHTIQAKREGVLGQAEPRHCHTESADLEGAI